MGEQLGVTLLAQGWSEPGTAPSPARVLPSLASSPDHRLCGATGALSVHLLVHGEGSQVPHASILLPQAPAARAESQGGSELDAYPPPPLSCPGSLQQAMAPQGCL